MMHLLVTNDYPPKIGGIQTYLWELWRRMPQDSFQVFTSPYANAATWDAQQDHHIERYDRFWMPPSRRVSNRTIAYADRIDASLVVIDPAFPLGAIGPDLGRPYAVILHGAEVSVPGRLPGSKELLRRAVANADLVISASRFAEAEAARVVDSMPPVVYVPPGVDTDRFVPLTADERSSARRRLGFDPDAPLVVGVSRLVPRKGFDTLIEAAARLAATHPGLQVVIAGTGRDEARLRRAIGQSGSPARLLGFVDDADLPALYGCADAFAMLCRERWGGLEQEGFGIVFVEAAAAGCPQIAGKSGGSAEAVAHGETGYVVDNPSDADAVAQSISDLLTHPERSEQMRHASRTHAVDKFSYDLLAERLHRSLQVFEQ
ncbi:glycosyltransferase family 4 protein [bacterium]|jgi:phosphatidylinositol alpha-1,6-mannosyltransferase|nr:glycosyltransferase family 4 protein [bacterium]